MASVKTNHASGNSGGQNRIASALIPVSRSLYRAGLWLVYGGATAEMIFHAAMNEGWSAGCASRHAAATARS